MFAAPNARDDRTGDSGYKGLLPMPFRPRYITFDCYGTLTRFRMDDIVREMFADRLPAAAMDKFIADFGIYRFDEVLGDWKPYAQVLQNALHRTCRKWGIECTDDE